MRDQLKGYGFFLVLYLVLVAGCSQVPPIHPYGERTYADANLAPLLIVGVGEGDEKIGKPVASSLFQTRLQLHRVAVHIEDVLRGNIPEQNITLYYFAFEHLNTSHPPLIFARAPSRRLIALRKEGAVYRTAIDGWNCADPIMSGAHPGYKPDPDKSYLQYDLELNMTRGEGPVDDGEFADAIRTRLGLLPSESIIDMLRHLALTESGKVKAAGCLGLGQSADWEIDKHQHEIARDSMKAAGCECAGSGARMVCR